MNFKQLLMLSILGGILASSATAFAEEVSQLDQKIRQQSAENSTSSTNQAPSRIQVGDFVPFASDYFFLRDALDAKLLRNTENEAIRLALQKIEKSVFEGLSADGVYFKVTIVPHFFLGPLSEIRLDVTLEFDSQEPQVVRTALYASKDFNKKGLLFSARSEPEYKNYSSLPDSDSAPKEPKENEDLPTESSQLEILLDHNKERDALVLQYLRYWTPDVFEAPLSSDSLVYGGMDTGGGK